MFLVAGFNMGSILDNAKRELNLISDEDMAYGSMMKDAVLEVLETLSNQNHSGMSAGIVISLVNRLWAGKPLTPLTGEDDEWSEPLEFLDGEQQNLRYHSVFKDKDGTCYDIDGRKFRCKDSNAVFRTNASHVPITFPYTVPDKYPLYILEHDTDEMSVEEQLKRGLYEIKY